MKAKLALGAALVLGAGCSFPTPSDGYRCEVTADCEAGRVCDQGFCVVPGGVDAQPTSSDSRGTDPFDCTAWTPAPRHFMPCDLPKPGAALVLDAGQYVFDTTTGTLNGPSTTGIVSKVIGGNRVISVERLTIGAAATLRVIGVQPLVVASWGAIEVSGTIDASSSGITSGAGANPGACSTHAATAAQNAADGASGGGGGGFQGAGARGGFGDVGNPGTGGGAVAPPLLLGGCPGASGGNGDQQNGGAGGAGGGAVQLTARQAITIASSGKVHAGGAGGGGSTGSDGGGGGGGSGGMIGLESPSIAVRSGAILAANGGGGGQGSDLAPGGAGQPGGPSLSAAAGGAGGDGGQGGAGSAGISLGGALGQNDIDHGAGGGGGGAGYIAIKGASRQVDAGAVISPPAITP